MSKSLGNVVAPQEVMQQSGADILRLWVVGSDYSEDLRIGPEILKHSERRLSPAAQHLALSVGRARRLLARRRRSGSRRCRSWSAGCCTAWPNSTHSSGARSRNSISTACSPRCTISARPICRRSISTSARIGSIATRPTTSGGGRCAPCSTAASIAWCAGWRRSSALPPRRPGSRATATCPERSVHLELFAEVPAAWHDPALASAGRHCAICAGSSPARSSWSAARNGSARACRRRSRCSSPSGSSRCSAGSIWPSCASPRPALVRPGPVPEGAFTLPDIADIGVRVSPAPGERCERCWRVLPEVGQVPGHADLCRRCAAVVDRGGAAARVASAG